MDVLNAVEPLNNFVCGLHGPTTSISRTMRRLVPFPAVLDSLPDADLLDLSVAVSVDAGPEIGDLQPLRTPGDRGAVGVVQASARYATSARQCEVEAFYASQLEQAGVLSVERSEPAGLYVVLEANIAWFTDDTTTSPTPITCRISIGEERGYRSVRVAAGYGGFDHHAIFDRFADWHNGDVPVPSTRQPTGIEISTFASGRKPETIALYTTHYQCDETPRTTVRTLVDDRIRELGWGYREPREGVMFMSDVAFDAETHVFGDEASSTVTFVGEFQLR